MFIMLPIDIVRDKNLKFTREIEYRRWSNTAL